MDNPVDNVVDNIIDRYSTEPQTVPESVSESEPHSVSHSVSHSEPLNIYKKEKEEKKVKTVEKKDGQLQALCDAYENYFSKPVTPKDRQKLSTYLSEYGFDSMLDTMEIMVKEKFASID